MNLPINFYDKVLKQLAKNRILSCNDHILIVAAGILDRDSFVKNAFNDVLITNIEKDRGVQDYEPYRWEYQDVENLTFGNNEFDWVFIHAGLHHCSSPHRGLCEMLRVAKKGIGVLESRDSLLNKLAEKSGFVPLYELEPCVLSSGESGGLRNTNIPNFVYRWTEREVRKTVNSYIPQYVHKFYFFYGLRIPNQRLAMSESVIKRFVGYSAVFLSPLFKALFPKQGNDFAFIISKTGKLQPWLKLNDNNLTFNTDYIAGRFKPEKYRS